LNAFAVLPEDTVLYILRYYEIPLYKYKFQFRKENYENVLMKLLFGYFRNGYNENRCIVTVFSSITLSCTNSNFYHRYDTVVADVILSLLTIPSIVVVNLQSCAPILKQIDINLSLRHIEKCK
jgi:hypothetical protein